MNARSSVVSILKRLAPRLWQSHAYRRYLRAAYGEREIHVISDLVDPTRWALDVGVHEGIYARHLSRFCKGVIGFEANPESANLAKRSLRGCAEIRHIALSDVSGTATLRIPVRGINRFEAALGTISINNPIIATDCVQVQVPMGRLDDIPLPPIGLIKIDVEGHEEAVLRGGVRILERDRPTYMIEIEERHNSGAIRRIFSYFGDRDYTTHYFGTTGLCLLDASVAVDMQTHNESYVNNFFFIPGERAKAMMGLSHG